MSVSYLSRRDADDNATWPSPPDPGDLSRRLVHRRGELRLSVAQVAARAQLNQRYVEYLERYPARPDPGVLRQLAAALQTSPATLLGGGSEVPPGRDVAGPRHPEGGQPEAGSAIRKLTVAECRQLIAPGGVGRVGFSTPSGPVVLPVNFVVISGAIVFRVGRGTLIEAHAYDRVAFEVDHIDDPLHQGWSVLVSGQAHVVLQPTEMRRLRTEASLRPWPTGEHEVWVRIPPERITGRRIESQ